VVVSDEVSSVSSEITSHADWALATATSAAAEAMAANFMVEAGGY
jgi:hypothetical protein